MAKLATPTSIAAKPVGPVGFGLMGKPKRTLKLVNVTKSELLNWY
jgi:hypothetical protein